MLVLLAFASVVRMELYISMHGPLNVKYELLCLPLPYIRLTRLLWSFVRPVLHKSRIKFRKPTLIPFLGRTPPGENRKKSYSKARAASLAETSAA